LIPAPENQPNRPLKAGNLLLNKAGSGTGSLEPAADVDLCVSFAAIVTGAGRVGIFLGPFIYSQVRAVAVDDQPANGILGFFAANLTSIDCVDHV
jgi:hypothetical protein